MGACPSKDMAIGIVIFNPAKSKKLISNYHEMMKHLQKYPVFTLELVYPGCEPELPDALHILLEVQCSNIHHLSYSYRMPGSS